MHSEHPNKMKFYVYIIALVQIAYGGKVSNTECSASAPCTSGTCTVDPFDNTKSYCFLTGPQGDCSTTRTGVCPKGLSTLTVQIPVTGSVVSCEWDCDCPAGKKCCLTGAQQKLCALEQTATSTASGTSGPTVTDIIVGSVLPEGQTAFVFESSVTYVESNGYKIIYDAGGLGQTNVLSSLKSKANIDAGDINMVVTSHGHPDHSINVYQYPNAVHNFYAFTVTGNRFQFNSLGLGQDYFLNDDPNLQLISTNGHTLQDSSLIVRNVSQAGTVCMVGDIMLNEADAVDPDASGADLAQLKSSRVTLVCLCDYIIPGHGPRFQVTEAIKQATFTFAGVTGC